MPHDLANNDGYIALNWAAEDREGWRHRERMSKPAYSIRPVNCVSVCLFAE